MCYHSFDLIRQVPNLYRLSDAVTSARNPFGKVQAVKNQHLACLEHFELLGVLVVVVVIVVAVLVLVVVLVMVVEEVAEVQAVVAAVAGEGSSSGQ